MHQMYHQFHYQQSHCVSLNPAIQFGHQHPYCTRSSMTVFARPEQFRLTKCQKFFRGRGTLWWNLLPTTVRASAHQELFTVFFIINFFLI